MRVEHINPVISSVINVLETMADVVPVAGKPTLKKSATASGVVSGLIALEGPEANGSLAVSFPEPVILDIYQRMLKEDKSSVDDMVVDLVGELANMIMGGAKQQFEEKGLQFGLTLPAMLQGEQHQIKHTVDGQVIQLPLTLDSGKIYIEFVFSN